MDLLEEIAESRIAEAIERGELDRLAGAGRPLKLDDDSMVPPELRAAYRILKNAGFVPPEIGIRNDIASLQGLILQCQDDAERRRVARRLSLLLCKLESRDGVNLRQEDTYYRKIVASFQKQKP